MHFSVFKIHSLLSSEILITWAQFFKTFHLDLSDPVSDRSGCFLEENKTDITLSPKAQINQHGNNHENDELV